MPSLDMNRETGEWISGWERTRQSILTILTTPRFSRVIRRYFGSETFELIDENMTDTNILLLYNAIAMALDGVVEDINGDLIEVPEFGEPCFLLEHVQLLAGNRCGQVDIILTGIEYPNGHKGEYTKSSAKTRTIDLISTNDISQISFAA